MIVLTPVGPTYGPNSCTLGHNYSLVIYVICVNSGVVVGQTTAEEILVTLWFVKPQPLERLPLVYKLTKQSVFQSIHVGQRFEDALRCWSAVNQLYETTLATLY